MVSPGEQALHGYSQGADVGKLTKKMFEIPGNPWEIPECARHMSRKINGITVQAKFVNKNV